jgi:hypothetical protein
LDTIIPITKTNACNTFVPSARRITRKTIPKATATAVTIWTKWFISTFNGEISVPRPLAIQDNYRKRKK